VGSYRASTWWGVFGPLRVGFLTGEKKPSEASRFLVVYVQSSLAPRANQKLAFKFFGPYKIIARVGQVVYEMELPAHSSIHPVFHVS